MDSSLAADDLISRASHLTAEQIATLASATQRAMGRGVRGHLGLGSRPFTTARRAVEATIRRADLEDEIGAKVPLVSEAVLTASIVAATTDGRDASRVREAWDGFQRVVDTGDRRQRQRAFRSAKKVIRQGIGPQLTRHWPMASVGATWALVVILTWDQATKEGPYTFADRAILTSPWATVSSVPI